METGPLPILECFVPGTHTKTVLHHSLETLQVMLSHFNCAESGYQAQDCPTESTRGCVRCPRRSAQRCHVREHYL